MFNLLITVLIVMIVAYMAYAESKYLFGKPTGCKTAQMKDELPKTIAAAKSALSKAVTNVKKETQKIKVMLQQKKAANNAPKALDISNPIEHIQASNTLVMSANAIEDTIDEDDLQPVDAVKDKAGELPAERSHLRQQPFIPKDQGQSTRSPNFWTDFSERVRPRPGASFR